MSWRVRRMSLIFSVVALATALLPAPAIAGHTFLTGEAPYITLELDGSLLPIITVGDPDFHGVDFQGIPDGS